jgi:L-threonylcarbamoyladenylate synthase
MKTDSVYRSPGELPYHYAPMKPLRIVHNIDEIKTANSSFLAFREPSTTPISRYTKVLSKTGDLKEAAANFFSDLIELDREDVEIIYAERVPETGIGKAIMERLKKASKKGAK